MIVIFEQQLEVVENFLFTLCCEALIILHHRMAVMAAKHAQENDVHIIERYSLTPFFTSGKDLVATANSVSSKSPSQILSSLFH